jgi:hypothetical protein
MNKFDKRLFLKLFSGFIAAAVIGTLSHEFGHYIVARILGYRATINYASTFWTPANSNDIVDEKNGFYITLAGPVLTILIGTVGVILLLLYRKRFYSSRELDFRMWIMIFLSVFWLRQTVNFFIWVGSFIVTRQYSTHGDEIKIAIYLQLPVWTFTALTAIIGILILTAIVLKFIPLRQRLTFLIAGLTGGIVSYVLWIQMFGKYILQ